MENILVGARVQITKDLYNLPYLSKRRGYTNFRVGQMGTIIKFNGSKNKVGIQFDDEVFTNHEYRLSSFDNGCHGVGKMYHCTYIPFEYFNVVGTSKETLNLMYYTPYKKVILVHDSVKSIFDDGVESSGYNTNYHFYLLDKVNNFMNSSSDKKSLILTYNQYFSNSEFINYVCNSLKIPLYSFEKNSSWDGYVLKNVRLHESMWMHQRYSNIVKQKPKVTLVIPRHNMFGKVYSDEHDIPFVKGNVSKKFASEVENELNDGDTIVVTRHHLKKFSQEFLDSAKFKYLTDFTQGCIEYVDFKTKIEFDYVVNNYGYKNIKNKKLEKITHMEKENKVYVVVGQFQKFVDATKNFIEHSFKFGGDMSVEERFESLNIFNKEGGNLLISYNTFRGGGIRYPQNTEFIYCAYVNPTTIVFSDDVKDIKKMINYNYGVSLSRPTDIIQSMGRVFRDEDIKHSIDVMQHVKSIASELIPIMPMSDPNIKIVFSDVVYDPINTDYENLIYTEHVEEL